MTGRGARLLERMGGGECLDLHAGVDHARERRIGLEVDAEEAGARGLTREANVADGRLLALDEIDGHDLGLEAFDIERDAYPVGRERAPEREQLHLIILPICRENRRRL